MRIFICVIYLFPLIAFGQTNGQLWNEVGVKGKLNKKLDWSLDINTRFGSLIGVETFFPQAGLKYKLTKWFRPSIDFRYALDQDCNGNFQPANRFMLNANFEKDITKRISFDFRVRYQYEFARWTNNSGYEQKLKQHVRFKPEITYNIKKSKFKPYANAELFYYLEPSNAHFSKFRIGVGTDLKTKGPFSFGAGYIYDKELDNLNGLPNIRHILTTSLKYKF